MKRYVGVAYGQNYIAYGSVVAIIDGADLNMKRFEDEIDKGDDDWIVELRSYAKKPETFDTYKD